VPVGGKPVRIRAADLGDVERVSGNLLAGGSELSFQLQAEMPRMRSSASGNGAQGFVLAEPTDRYLVTGMGHCKGKDNVKKRAARRKKMERLQAAQNIGKKDR
jgi:hypothetical protein